MREGQRVGGGGSERSFVTGSACTIRKASVAGVPWRSEAQALEGDFTPVLRSPHLRIASHGSGVGSLSTCTAGKVMASSILDWGCWLRVLTSSVFLLIATGDVGKSVARISSNWYQQTPETNMG